MRLLPPLVALLMLTACGVPVDSEPEMLTIEVEDPPEIVEPSPENLETATVFLVRDDTLVPVTRDLESPASVDQILVSLLEGVTDPEERAGLRTSIPQSTQLSGTNLGPGGVVEVDLNREFTSVGGEQEILAVAQIVLTLTATPEVVAVSFLIESVPTAVPDAAGALADEPVDESDYRDLVGQS